MVISSIKYIKVFIICSLLSGLLLPASVYAFGAEVAAGFWRQNISGDIAYSPLSDQDVLNLQDDLGYDSKNRPYLRAKVELPAFLPNLYFMATPMRFDGDSLVGKSFRFGDTEFFAGESIYSEVKLDHYDVGLFYSIPFLEAATLGKLNVEVGLDARVVDLSAEVRSNTTGISEKESLVFAFPMLYASVRVRPFEFLSIEAEGRGIAYNSHHYIDLIGRLRISPFGPLFVAGGYRYEDVDFDESDILVDATFEGPFVEAGLEF